MAGFPTKLGQRAFISLVADIAGGELETGDVKEWRGFPSTDLRESMACVWHTWRLPWTALMGESWNGRLTGVQRAVFVVKTLLPRRSEVGFMQLPLERPPQKAPFELPLKPISQDTLAFRVEMCRINR